MMEHLTEQHRTGLECLRSITSLLQRVRSSHPTAGLYEASDFQWWWRSPRPTDAMPQLFWVDDLGRPEAAAIVTSWGESVGLDPLLLPDADPEWTLHVLDRGLAHAAEHGYDRVDLAVDTTDSAMIAALAERGYTQLEPELAESWLGADDRPVVSPLADGYRLVTRLDLAASPHLRTRSGPDVEQRLRETSLYREDLELVVLDEEDQVAAYGLFWFDPVSGTGLVEPMRTEDEHQRQGLARHVLTSGVNRLIDAGATRVKICFEESNAAAHHLYLDVGFIVSRRCWAISKP